MQQDLRKLQKLCWHRASAKKQKIEKRNWLSQETRVVFCGSFCVYFAFGR